MKVVFNGLEGARFYRGITFSPGESVEVSEEWFEECKNPNIVEGEAKKKRTRRTKEQIAADEAKANDDSE